MGRFYEFTCRAAKLVPFGDVIFLFYVFTSRVRQPTVSDGPILLCTFFTSLSTFPTPFGDVIFLFYVFTGILFSERPPVAISFFA